MNRCGTNRAVRSFASSYPTLLLEPSEPRSGWLSVLAVSGVWRGEPSHSAAWLVPRSRIGLSLG